MPDPSRGYRKLDPERVEQLYLLGQSTADIARGFGASRQAVGDALRKRGVALRRGGARERPAAPAGRRRCPDCGGLFHPDGFYWTKERQDIYCKACRKRRVAASTSPEQRKAAKARYVAKHGREKINADERRRKNHLGLDGPVDIQVR